VTSYTHRLNPRAARSPPPMAGAGGQARVMRCLEQPDIDVVSCHAFSQDLSYLALYPNNEEIHIFRVGQDFQRQSVLSKHTQRVSGLAWSNTDRLASVSEDRTAFVWECDSGSSTWRSTIVELRTARAANCVEWSADGLRLAVGMSSRELAICSHDAELEVWSAKKVGKYKAAVVAVAWHPSSMYVATGSTDRMLHVWDVNESGDSFGQPQVNADAGAWINGVCFSESGNYLACMPQDSTVRIKDLSKGPEGPLQRVRWRGLPFIRGVFLGDSCLIACGFDKVPVLFRVGGAGSWQVTGSVDVTTKVSGSLKSGAFEGARNMFKGGSSGQEAKAETVATLHTNTITSCRLAGANQFSTSGLDGQVALWELVT